MEQVNRTTLSSIMEGFDKLNNKNDPFGYKRAEMIQKSRDDEEKDMMKKLKAKEEDDKR